jgi:hypothetical protein
MKMIYAMLTLLVFSGVLVGFTIGVMVANEAKRNDTVTLVPYNGLGSGVLKHGTVLKDNYEGPDSISGNLDIPGVWVIGGKQ